MTIRAQNGLGKFARRGFALQHPNDHVVLLMHDGEQIAVFSQTGATPESLREECAKHLALHHGCEAGSRAQGERGAG